MNKPKWHVPSWLATHLSLLDITTDLRRFLEPIDAAISKEREFALSQGESEDGLLEMEVAEVIESLQGAAFVVAQAVITNVCSRIASIHEHQKIKKSTQLTTTANGRKHELLALGPTLDCGYTSAALVNHLANYFKHRDEWGADALRLEGDESERPQVRKLSDDAKRTIEALHAIGMDDRNLGIRVGAVYLGGDGDICRLASIVDEWKDEVVARYRDECLQKGLLQAR